MSNNKIILTGCITNFKANNGLTGQDSEIFELFALSQITKDFDLSFDDIEGSIVDGGNDGGIDSLVVLVDDECIMSVEDIEEIKFSSKSQVTIILTQSKKESSFKEAALDKLITTLPELFDLGKSEDALLQRFNPDLVNVALVARTIWKEVMIAGGKLKLIMNYCCFAEQVEITGAFEAKVEQLKELAAKQFVGAEIQYSNYSAEELLRLFQLQKNQRLSLKFKENPLSTSFGDSGIGYVGTVKLGDYKSFISDTDGSVRDDLFESNIRHFQGLVDVNKKIKQTIEEINASEDFWWLNNGITIIATNPSLVATTLSLDDVQIVNGLQTSYSIFNNHPGNQDDPRSVLVKVIITEDKATIDHVIASTNSQNAVSPVLLRATDEVQRRLELFFLNAGYFYDRRKNFYKNQNKPAARIYSIQTAAQAIESILFYSPHAARSKPTTLVKDDTAYARIFDGNKDFRAYLNSCLILRKTLEFWGAITDSEIKGQLSNFKLHLARVACSCILTSARFDANQVAGISLDKYNQDVFREALNETIAAINNYKEENPDANLINMAKARGLTDKLMDQLVDKYQQSS